jgi:hypothetical protein
MTMEPTLEPTMAFAIQTPEPPGIAVCVNFGVYAGREATAAEIERLAEWLLDEVEGVSIIAQDRHEIAARVEASVHQVLIEVEAANVPAGEEQRIELERRILERAEYWARQCVAERHADVAEL